MAFWEIAISRFLFSKKRPKLKNFRGEITKGSTYESLETPRLDQSRKTASQDYFKPVINGSVWQVESVTKDLISRIINIYLS